MKLQLFNISNFKVDGGAMFGVVPKVLWSRVYSSDENNLIVLTLRSLVIETDEHVILVDTGWGDKQDEKFFRHVYLHGGEGLTEGLNRRGYKPEDITDVVLTHLHADHCGGGVKRNEGGTGYELTFPEATYHVSRTQWEWAVKNNVREADSFLDENIIPIMDSGHLNLVDEEGELFPGFSVRICYGHTPGLMIPVIKYKNKTLSAKSSGDGPVDACFKAIDKITGVKGELQDYRIEAVTRGKDALGEVSLKLKAKGKVVGARGASTDIIEASARAYVNALNKIESL